MLMPKRINQTILTVTCICIVIAVLSPIASFTYFNNMNRLQVSIIQQENDILREENSNLNSAPYSMKPYLVTNLGWYLHNSSDPITESKRTFTIYGYLSIVGATNATNCKLLINFYDSRTLLQTSQLDIGVIPYWSYHSIHTVMDCIIADSVTRIEIKPEWS